jgi:transposase-like protein
VPARKIRTSLQKQHNLELTHSTVLNLVQRAVKATRSAFEQVKAAIRTFFNVYIDETSIKVAGKTFWVWVFTMLTATLLVIRKSRHCKVIEEVLGEDFEGVINCDG